MNTYITNELKRNNLELQSIVSIHFSYTHNPGPQ